MANDDERTPIDDLVDLLLYAPVGLLYEYEEVLPKLIRRGKSQVQLARVLGTMAVRGQGPVPTNLVVEAVTSMVVDRITEIGASIGLAPQAAGGSDAAETDITDVSEAKVNDEADTGDDRASGGDRASDDDTVPDDAPLPIASYDTLTAREIIGLLDELDAGQLARIRAHEESNRARKTVLGKLDRLSA